MDDIAKIQERYLGLGAEINIAAQLRTQYEDAMLNPDEHYRSPNLDSLISEQSQKIVLLTRQRNSLQFLLQAKNMIPDEDAWRHPPMPDVVPALLAERAEVKVTEPKLEMQHVEKPKKKSARKGAAIKPRVAKIKK